MVGLCHYVVSPYKNRDLVPPRIFLSLHFSPTNP